MVASIKMWKNSESSLAVDSERCEPASSKSISEVKELHLRPRGAFPVAVSHGDADFGEWFKLLDQMSALQADWDSYGAEAPNEIASQGARSILGYLCEANIEPSRVAPSVENGVGITFQREGKYVYIESSNLGEVIILMANEGREPNIHETDASPDNLREMVNNIRVFLSR